MADQEPIRKITLVKYNNPVSVNIHENKKSNKYKISSSDPLSTEANQEIPRIPLGIAGVCQPSVLGKQETEEILNAIIPPKEWKVDDGKVWRQTVSTVPATNSDVIGLQELLDRRLKEKNARETGICQARRDLYTQFFDELIRQVTIISAERGLLLLRVRNEIRRTFTAYESLYESAMSIGIRKALMGAEAKEQIEKETAEEETVVQHLKKEMTDLQHQYRHIHAKHTHKRDALMQARAEELARQKEINDAVKQQIWAAVFQRAAANVQYYE